MEKRKIILNLAMSLDGYIAREDGSFDWIVGDEDSSNNTENQFDFEKFVESVDTVIMGRKAYEDLPEESIPMYDNKTVYVATSKELEPKVKKLETVKEDILELVLKLQKGEGKNIWLYGGAGLTDEFIKSNVVDEYVVGVIPIILGKGRKLFLEDNPTIKLHLLESTCQEGVVVLRYSKK